MNELQHAVAINSEAVSHVFHNRGDNAAIPMNLSSFQEAVRAMRVFNEEMVAMFGSQPVASETNHGSTGFSFTREFPETLAGRESDYGLVYNRPLFLPTDRRLDNRHELESAGVVVSTTAIFNAAITWHEFGMVTGRDKPLLKAGKLYELVVAVLNQSSDDVDDPSYGIKL